MAEWGAPSLESCAPQRSHHKHRASASHACGGGKAMLCAMGQSAAVRRTGADGNCFTAPCLSILWLCMGHHGDKGWRGRAGEQALCWLK